MWWSSQLSRPRRQAPNWILACAGMTLCVLLAACGFQLRGDPAVGIKALFVPGPGVAQEIRRALAAGPTKVVVNPSEAEASLAVLAEARDKRVYTITGAGRVYEFELRLVVRYEMRMPGQEMPVIAPTELIARRIITHSESASAVSRAVDFRPEGGYN